MRAPESRAAAVLLCQEVAGAGVRLEGLSGVLEAATRDQVQLLLKHGLCAAMRAACKQLDKQPGGRTDALFLAMWALTARFNALDRRALQNVMAAADLVELTRAGLALATLQLRRTPREVRLARDVPLLLCQLAHLVRSKKIFAAEMLDAVLQDNALHDLLAASRTYGDIPVLRGLVDFAHRLARVSSRLLADKPLPRLRLALASGLEEPVDEVLKARTHDAFFAACHALVDRVCARGRRAMQVPCFEARLSTRCDAPFLSRGPGRPLLCLDVNRTGLSMLLSTEELATAPFAAVRGVSATKGRVSVVLAAMEGEGHLAESLQALGEPGKPGDTLTCVLEPPAGAAERVEAFFRCAQRGLADTRQLFVACPGEESSTNGGQSRVSVCQQPIKVALRTPTPTAERDAAQRLSPPRSESRRLATPPDKSAAEKESAPPGKSASVQRTPAGPPTPRTPRAATPPARRNALLSGGSLHKKTLSELELLAKTTNVAVFRRFFDRSNRTMWYPSGKKARWSKSDLVQALTAKPVKRTLDPTLASSLSAGVRPKRPPTPPPKPAKPTSASPPQREAPATPDGSVPPTQSPSADSSPAVQRVEAAAAQRAKRSRQLEKDERPRKHERQVHKQEQQEAAWAAPEVKRMRVEVDKLSTRVTTLGGEQDKLLKQVSGAQRLFSEMRATLKTQTADTAELAASLTQQAGRIKGAEATGTSAMDRCQALHERVTALAAGLDKLESHITELDETIAAAPLREGRHNSATMTSGATINTGIGLGVGVGGNSAGLASWAEGELVALQLPSSSDPELQDCLHKIRAQYRTDRRELALAVQRAHDRLAEGLERCKRRVQQSQAQLEKRSDLLAGKRASKRSERAALALRLRSACADLEMQLEAQRRVLSAHGAAAAEVETRLEGLRCKMQKTAQTAARSQAQQEQQAHAALRELEAFSKDKVTAFQKRKRQSERAIQRLQSLLASSFTD